MPSKVWRGSLDADAQPEASPPHKAKKNVDSFAGSSQERHSSPLHTPVLTLACSGARVRGGKQGWAAPSALHGGHCLSFLGPEGMPALNTPGRAAQRGVQTIRCSPKRNVNLKGDTVFTVLERQHPTAATRNKAMTQGGTKVPHRRR